MNVRHTGDPADSGADYDLPWARDERVQAWLAELAADAPQPATEAVRDLLTFAVAAYVADKAVVRMAEPDRWTRQLELRVPLVDPLNWATDVSEQLLHRLTGDVWRVVPRQARTPLVEWPAVQITTTATAPSEVALFSGGLDSLSYLAEVVAANRHVEFVAHFDPNAPKSLQRSLFDTVAPAGSPLRLRQFGVRLAGSDPVYGGQKESTTRARAVVFIAGAVAAATMVGAPSVAIPENGFVSINVPLGPNRIGSLSTRTTHPATIGLYQDVLDALGIPVMLGTRYALLTKGDVLRLGRSAGLDPATLTAAVSCAHPRQGRWQREEFGNCGYCYACLIRRAALHVSGGDPTTYLYDPRQNMRAFGAKRGSDFRAVVTFLDRPLRPSAVVSAGPVPEGYQVDAAYTMLQRGREELRTMIDSGLSSSVRATIGW